LINKLIFSGLTKNYLKIWYILFDVVGSARADPVEDNLFRSPPAKGHGEFALHLSSMGSSTPALFFLYCFG